MTERTGFPVLDYATGRSHFIAAQLQATAHGSAEYIFNILGAMQHDGVFEDMEKGFCDALASQAAVGCRPGPIGADFGVADQAFRSLQRNAWEVIRSGSPEQIAGFVKSQILGRGVSSLIFLDVVAACAHNGRLD